MREEFFTRIALCALLGTLAACNDSSGDGSLLAAVASVSGGNPEVSAARIAAAAPVTPRAGLVLSCSTATATVQFAACPNGKLVYSVPAAGVYVESSTVATNTIPGYSAATHVFQPYQKAVAVVICTVVETPGLAVTYNTDPCTRSHAMAAGPAAAGSSSSGGGSSSSSSSSSSGGVSSSSSSGGITSSSSTSGSSSSGGGSSSGSSSGGKSSSRASGGVWVVFRANPPAAAGGSSSGSSSGNLQRLLGRQLL